GEIQRAGALGVLTCLTTTIEVGVDYAWAIGQCLLGSAQLFGLPAAQGFEELRISGSAAGVGSQLSQGLLDGRRLALAPGLGQLRGLLLLSSLVGEPGQRGGYGEPGQARQQSGRQCA